MSIKRNFFRDILRDTNSRKFSMTKFAAFTSVWLLVAAAGSGIGIMIYNNSVDHILIGELIALLLTLLGFKNFRGNFKSTESDKSISPKPKNFEQNDVLENGDKDEVG